MSSHHFVKEGQEPALLISDAIGWKHVQSLLEWAPRVIVVDTVLDDVLSWGIKIDVVLSDGKCLSEVNEKIANQLPVAIVQYHADETALHAGLTNLARTNQHAVTIISNTPDQVFNEVQNFTSQLDIVIVTDEYKWSFSTDGRFKKWLAAGSQLIVQTTCQSQQFSTEGLDHKHSGHYVTNADNLVSITSPYPFWAGECL